MALSLLEPSQKKNTTSEDISHRNHTIKTNQVLRRTKEKSNYSYSKTGGKFLLCMFMKETLYNVVKMSYQDPYTNTIVSDDSFLRASISRF